MLTQWELVPLKGMKPHPDVWACLNLQQEVTPTLLRVHPRDSPDTIPAHLHPLQTGELHLKVPPAVTRALIRLSRFYGFWGWFKGIKAEKVETTLVSSRFSVLGFPTKKTTSILIVSSGNDSKQGSFIVVSAKNDLIWHLLPGNKPIIESFKGGGDAR